MKKDYKQGEELKLSNGQTAIFVRGKKTKFIGTIDGTIYDIPFAMIVTEDGQLKKKESSETINNLVKGDKFYIDKNGKAILFVYESSNDKTIVGINPINNNRTRISKEFNFYKV